MALLRLVTVILPFLSSALCANILVFSHVPSVSHQQAFEVTSKELSLRGHQVTWVSPNPLKDTTLTNLTVIDVSFVYDQSHFISKMDGWYPSIMSGVHIYMENVLDRILTHDLVTDLWRQPQKFDLVIVEMYHPLVYTLGTVFQAPIIGLTTTDLFLYTHTEMGSPVHPSLFGDFIIPSCKSLSLWQKVENVFLVVWMKWYYSQVLVPRSDDMAKKLFGDGLPSVTESVKNVSLVMSSSIYFTGQCRPQPANFVPIGFLHVKPPGTLEPNLQEVLDKATNGAVYVSFGSNVKSSSLGPEIVNVIVQTVSNLPYTVLWKWETDEVPKFQGSNVITRKWFPQQDVLGHPNVKVFVTQGGLQSIEEAISRAVPMVGIPKVSDQFVNLDRLVQKGIAKKLDWTTLNVEDFTKAIVTVAEDSSYKRKIEEVRSIAYDQPISEIEKVVWWTEYVLRHRGAPHLRSALADFSLIEYLLLDVLFVVLIALVILLFVAHRVTKSLINLFRPRNAVTHKKYN